MNDEEERMKQSSVRKERKKDRVPSEQKNPKGESSEIICYECRKPGHMRSECPKINKKKRWTLKKDKKKSLVTLGDLDDSSSESSDEKTANICLMEHDSNQVNGHVTDCSSSDSSSSSSESDFKDENDMSYETLLANSQFTAQAYKACK